MFCYLAREKTSVTQRVQDRGSRPPPRPRSELPTSAIVADGVAVGPWPQAQPALHGKMSIVVACWRHTPLCWSQLIALYCGATGARHAPLHRLPLQPRPQPAPPLLSTPIPSAVGSHCHVTSHAPHGASSLPRHVACSTRRFVTATSRRSTRRFDSAAAELHTSPDASHLLRRSPPPRDPPVTARFSLSPRPSPPLACMLISGEISRSISRPSPPLACSASSASEAGNKVHSRHLDGLLPFAQIAPQLPLQSLA